MDPVRLCGLNDEFTAQSLHDLLDQSGIPSMIRKNILPGYELAMPSTVLHGWGELLVNKSDLERASELVAGFLGGLGELAESDEQGPA